MYNGDQQNNYVNDNINHANVILDNGKGDGSRNVVLCCINNDTQSVNKDDKKTNCQASAIANSSVIHHGDDDNQCHKN